ncbi:MAG: flagellar biosynthesis protein FlhB [Lachnospiraceae bacterium]|nr:flagellar biosynthesis protein FlhB [Lachnospiraceae bacterium]
MMLEKKLLIAYNLQFFAKEGPGGEKTEPATAKRLREARNKGQVAKSKEVVQAASLLTFFLLIQFWTSSLAFRAETFFPAIYNRMDEVTTLYHGEMPFGNMRALFVEMLTNAMVWMAPFLAVGVVVSFLGNKVQFKWKIVTKPFKPKFSKMNPISGIKKIFSKQSLFNLLLSIVKIVIISFVVYNYLTGREESIFLLYDMPLRQAMSLMKDIIVGLGIRISLFYVIVAVVDYIYQKRKFREDMKMTKQEVKDEMKSDEGDPQIKAKQRQRMREASMRRMMQQLPQADVVITNPDHFAVAIQYDAEKFPAPVVLAKGAGHLAQRIKDVAGEHHIEIVENKPLARMLYANVDIGEMVPPELYKAVAEVLAFVYHLQGKV